MKESNRRVWSISLAAAIGLLAGCGASESPQKQESEPAKQEEMSTEPVTLRLQYFGFLISPEEVQQFVAEPIKKKYPFITVEYMPQVQGVPLEMLVQTDNAPDIVFTDFVNSIPVMNYKLPLDLSPLVKANKVDLTQFDPEILKGIQSIGRSGELYGLPFYSEKFVMFYNKNLFDKFGVSYPSDQMSYEDLLNTIRRVTRVEDGVQYTGMASHNVQTTGTFWGIPVVNEKTEKADFQTDEWKRVLNLIKDIRTIPGNLQGSTLKFYKDQTQALMPQMANVMLNLLKTVDGSFDWDMVAMPQHKDYPGISGAVRPSYLLVSQMSKHREQAAAAVSYLTTSAEHHLNLAKHGKLPPVKLASANDPLLQQFGSEVALLKGKNVRALFLHKSAPLPYITEYDKIAATELNKADGWVVNGTHDVNTALRMAEESANKLIDEQKNAK